MILGLTAEFYLGHEDEDENPDVALDASSAFSVTIAKLDLSVEDLVQLYVELYEAVPDPGVIGESGCKGYIEFLKSPLYALGDNHPIIALVIDAIEKQLGELSYQDHLAARKRTFETSFVAQTTQ